MSDRNEEEAGYEELPEERDPDAVLDETQPHDDDDDDPDQSAIEGEEATSQQPPSAARPPQDVQQEEEVLPPEKPWTGVFEMRLPGCQGLQQVKVPDHSNIPSWLQYVLIDDAFYFKYTVFPDAKQKARPVVGDGQEGEDGEDGAAAPPPPPADDPAAGEEDGEGVAGGSSCAPNLMLYIQQARDGSFVLSTEREEDDRPVQSTSPSTANAGANAVEDNNEEPTSGDGVDGSGALEGGDGDADADASGAAGGSPTAAAAKDMATAKAAAAAAAAAASANSLLSFSIDAITLTAIRCPDVLPLMLGVPGTSIDRLVQWALSDPPSTEQILSVTANAKASVAANPLLLKVPTDVEPIFASVRDDPRQHLAMQQVLIALVRNGFVPRAPLRSDLCLTTPDTVWLYLTMLLHMPRSVLLQWTLPLVAEGDDPVDEDTRKAKPLSNLLGTILLDVRRRSARATSGKRPLRTTALRTYQALMPKLFKAEQDADTVVTKLYSTKSDGTTPLSLTLFQSDLLLLLLGSSPEDDVAPLFVDVLRLRTQHPNRGHSGDRAAVWHLMYSHVHHLRPWAVETLIAQTPEGSLFVRGGLARIEDFASRFLLEYDGRFASAPGACPEAVARTHLFQERYAGAFTAKFWRELSQSEATMIALERQGSAFLLCLLRAQAAYRKVAQATIQQPPLDAEAMTEVLDEVAMAAKTGQPVVVLPQTVFHARLMGLAVDAQNYTVVRYLATNHSVVTTQAEDNGAHVGLLDDALRRHDLPLLDTLVTLGVQLSHMLRHGMCSGLSLLQASTAAASQEGGCLGGAASTTAAMANTILQHWMTVEKDRVADPNHRHGLLLTLPSVPA